MLSGEEETATLNDTRRLTDEEVTSQNTAVGAPAPDLRPGGSDFGVEQLRALAKSLDITQETVLEVAEVDPSFLIGLPPDLREEVVLHHLRSLQNQNCPAVVWT